MKNETINYWAYRIDCNQRDFFEKELHQHNILRQGWGHNEGQDLRNLKYDGGAKKNLPMFNNVKKGDILLVPRLPDWDSVAIVKATEDWDTAYSFEIDEKLKDYGHKFPADYIKCFNRHNKAVSGYIRSTLKSPRRFWNINAYKDDIIAIMNTEESLTTYEKYSSRLNNAVSKTFTTNLGEASFKDALHEKISEQVQASEWEFLLQYGLQKLFPYYEIEKTGGITEAKHGSDIIIKLPSIFSSGKSYVVAAQIKDWGGAVSEDLLKEAISQVGKADSFYENNKSVEVIDKVIIFTKISAGDEVLDKYENNEENNKGNVRFVYADEFKELLKGISKKIIIEQIEKY